MVMGAWGIFAAPLIATAPFKDNPEAHAAVVEAFDTIELAAMPTDDLFGELATMDDAAMSSASGGSVTAFDIGNIGVNYADNDGSVNNIEANYSETGKIVDNTVSGNSGLTTVFFNSGNGVVFQSNVNVNVFLDSKPPTP